MEKVGMDSENSQKHKSTKITHQKPQERVGCINYEWILAV